MSSSSLDYLYKTSFSNQVTFEAVGLGSHSILRGPSGTCKLGDGFTAAFSASFKTVASRLSQWPGSCFAE